MAAKKGTHTEQIDALTRHVARLGRRIKALEEQRYRELTSAIGFEIESVEVEVDDEELPEMTATLVRRRR